MEGLEIYEKKDEQFIIKNAIERARPYDGEVDLKPDNLEPTVSIEDIKTSQCRWPITQFVWCGRPSGKKVYCDYHAERARRKTNVSDL